MAIYNGGLSIKNVSIGTATGSGNAITSLSADGNVITPNKGSTFVTNFDLELGSGNQYLIGASSQTGNIKSAKTSGAYYNGSNLYANGFYVSSLRSLKENIEPTKVKATDLINSQEIVDFNYKADEDKVRKIGLIADDSDPLFLDKRGETVDLYNTCGILMKAVQELSKRIEELEQRLN